MGYLELYLIYSFGGIWENTWIEAQKNPTVGDLLTTVSGETMAHCLNGWTSPFVKALGLPPYGCLLKLSKELSLCHHREKCLFFNKKTCFPTAKKTPSCFEPESSEEERPLLTELIRLWREGVYVILVQEPNDARR